MKKRTAERPVVRRRKFTLLASLATAWPAATRAQRGPTLGILSSSKMADWAIEPFRAGLRDGGYVEGQNLTVIYRYAENRFDQLPVLAAELVGNQVSVIFATGSPVPARAAKAATTTIPIVFAYGGDPVSDGLVASISRPEANVTGATFIGTALTSKRLELLRQMIPQLADVALLVNPNGTLAEVQIREARVAAQALGLTLSIVNASSENEIDDAFAKMNRLKVGASMVSIDPLFGFGERRLQVVSASRYRIPTMYGMRSNPLAGGLISYGPNLSDTWRQAGIYVGRILKGEKPSDLPVMQPTRFELVINLRTAKQLGIDVPTMLLARADEIIE